jgi:hypothetical protein
VGFKRRDLMPEEDLLRDVQRQAREVDLRAVKGAAEDVLARAKSAHDKAPQDRRRRAWAGKNDPVPRPAAEPVLELLARRDDLKGLPVRMGADCQVSQDTAVKMGKLSRGVDVIRRASSVGSSRWSGPGGPLPGLQELVTEETVSTLVQMLEVGPPYNRGHLTTLLTGKQGRKATALLARQALFDFAANVREAAVKALEDRPREDYRAALLDGLRHPWPPVADHAAEALVALDDQAATFHLLSMLDEPDPGAPALNKDNKWFVSEMVRVNHLRNCLLCHAPSFAPDDPVRGLVPTPGEPLPQGYNASRRGNFVRADITYLRQDFSAIQPVPDHGRWPTYQRFDYLVRTRELTAEERAAEDRRKEQPRPVSYPQRNAVLFALRELTGVDAGDSSADWYQLLWTARMLSPP